MPGCWWMLACGGGVCASRAHFHAWLDLRGRTYSEVHNYLRVVAWTRTKARDSRNFLHLNVHLRVERTRTKAAVSCTHVVAVAHARTDLWRFVLPLLTAWALRPRRNHLCFFLPSIPHGTLVKVSLKGPKSWGNVLLVKSLGRLYGIMINRCN